MLMGEPSRPSAMLLYAKPNSSLSWIGYRVGCFSLNVFENNAWRLRNSDVDRGAGAGILWGSQTTTAAKCDVIEFPLVLQLFERSCE